MSGLHNTDIQPVSAVYLQKYLVNQVLSIFLKKEKKTDCQF